MGPWRTHEFYDNAHGYGGSPKGTLAIEGRATNVVYVAGPGTDIVFFDICVWITNDTPWVEGEFDSGFNSHGESRGGQQYYVGCMYGVKLTASFAIDEFTPPPFPGAGPYRDRRPYIVATNHDGLAWYCWTPDNPDPYKVPWGDYYVPTWDVGDIPVWVTVEGRPLCKFKIMERDAGGQLIPATLPPWDPRWVAIDTSYRYKKDLLLNRTRSLKVSNWIDEIRLDPGSPYPTPPSRSSDCSVFHLTRDWGDAPGDWFYPRYPTLEADDGPSHLIRADFCLGATIDGESDGQPTWRADGDDNNPPLPAPDDEDGVSWFTPLIPGQEAQVEVFLTTPGTIAAFLDAWIDFNGDGDWDELDDYIAGVVPLDPGENRISFDVPEGARLGRTYARFRLSSTGVFWTGPAIDGEVEDYAVIIQLQPDQGTLTFDENIDIPDHFWDPTADQYNEMLSLTVGAGQWDSVSWDTITLQAGGSGNDQTDIASVDVWIDNNNDGSVDPGDTWIGTGQYPGDDGALAIAIGRLQVPYGPVIISAGTSISVLISYTMSGAPPAGGTYQFDVTDATGTGQTTGEPAVIIGLSIPSSLKTIAPGPITIGEAKLEPVGTLVYLEDKVLTADFVYSMGLLYIEEADRSAGIGVRGGTIIGPINVGNRVSVLGNTNLLYGTELVLEAQQILLSPGEPISPVGMNNRWTGGASFGAQPGIWGAIGLSNVGMLIRTWGRVISSDPAPTLPPGIVVQPVVWIDDGANLWDAYWGRPGVAVLLPQSVPLPPTNQYVGVTGIMRCIPSAGVGPPVRLLCPRDANDIRRYP